MNKSAKADSVLADAIEQSEGVCLIYGSGDGWLNTEQKARVVLLLRAAGALSSLGWVELKQKKPPVGKVVLISDGEGLALAQYAASLGSPWHVEGVIGWEWELDFEPTHWKAVDVSRP